MSIIFVEEIVDLFGVNIQIAAKNGVFFVR
jgi:hypothetical protein